MRTPTSEPVIGSVVYVAMDVGCLECQVGSTCLGVFKTRQAADARCRQEMDREAWDDGQHAFVVFSSELAG
jgi:hypothetical protein